MADLKNKKINIMGDSITEGVGASKHDKCYVEVFKKISKANVINYGISGTRIAKQLNDKLPNYGKCFVEQVDDMDDFADYVVVFGGTNDFGHGDAPLGNFTDTEETSFCGAVDKLIKKLYVKYPNARIVFLTPLHKYSEDLDVNEVGIRTSKLVEYVKALRYICDKYSVPVLDLWANANITTKIDVIKEKYIPDGVHPSDLGHERIAKMLYSFLTNLE